MVTFSRTLFLTLEVAGNRTCTPETHVDDGNDT